jgi:hypothetical protein
VIVITVSHETGEDGWCLVRQAPDFSFVKLTRMRGDVNLIIRKRGFDLFYR